MYCQKCGKQISSIADECPYCKSKVNENTKPNNVLYYGMNGKPVTIWKFVVGIIIMIIGIYFAFQSAKDLGTHWMG